MVRAVVGLLPVTVRTTAWGSRCPGAGPNGDAMSTLVHLDLQLDPSGLEQGRQVLVETLAATRAWPGNEGLEVVVDDTDPAHLLVVEHWARTADHDAYAAWRATPEGASRLGEVVVAPPTKTVFSASLPLPF